MNIQQTTVGQLTARQKRSFEVEGLTDSSRVFIARQGNRTVANAVVTHHNGYFERSLDVDVQARSDAQREELVSYVREALAPLKRKITIL